MASFLSVTPYAGATAVACVRNFTFLWVSISLTLSSFARASVLNARALFFFFFLALCGRGHSVSDLPFGSALGTLLFQLCASLGRSCFVLGVVTSFVDPGDPRYAYVFHPELAPSVFPPYAALRVDRTFSYCAHFVPSLV